jgi:hypothetical protein
MNGRRAGWTRLLARAVATGLAASRAPGGVVLPFTEDFSRGNADWYDAAGAAPVGWAPSGGPDGGAFVLTSYTVPDPAPPMGQIVFRAQDEFGSSGGAFEGNWIAAGVNEFSFFFKHDAPAPLGVFARFAAPANFPGAIGLVFAPVPPGVWTFLSIPIAPDSPNIVLEGTSFESVFRNVGHVQIGILPGPELAGLTLQLKLDKVSIVPAPGALPLVAALALACPRRRRPAQGSHK